MNRDVLLLLARIGLSAVFLYSGLDKLAHWPDAVDEAKGLGLPLPTLAMAVTVSVQLAGGLSVLLGIWARFGAALLLLFTVTVTLIAHWPFGVDAAVLRQQLTLCLEHLAIVGGFLALIAAGAGRLGIDGRRG